MRSDLQVAVIGNSHVAALREGWNEARRDFPGVRLVFHASRGAGLRDLRPDPERMRLVPMHANVRTDVAYTSGGDGSIGLGGVDLCIVCGLDLPGRFCYGDESDLSAAVLDAVLADRAACAATGVLEQIRRISAVPVLLAHVPLPGSDDPGAARVAADDGWRQQYADGLSWVNARWFESRCALVVPQPAETLGTPWRTRRSYSAGSRRLDIGDSVSGEPHAPGDDIHMNADYGASWLGQCLSSWIASRRG